MTSPAGPQFRFRWLASDSRAGVFVNGSPADADSVTSSCTSQDTDGSLEDSFSTQFAPLPMSRGSSCSSVGPSQSGSRVPDSTPPGVEAAAGLPAAGKPWALVDRLRQLKQLQQHMQQQLKAHRREQLQTLQNEHPRPSGTTRTAAASDDPDRPSPERAERPGPNSSTVPPSVRRGLREPGEAEGTPEPSAWNREPSADRAASGRPGDRDEGSARLDDGKREETDPPIGSGGGGRTFEEMLEEQLRLENQKLNDMTSVPPNAAKPKRPFLRRGEGLSRFAGGKSARPVRNEASRSEPKRTSPGSPGATNIATRRKTAVLTKTDVPPKTLAPVTEASSKADRNVRVKRRDEPADPDRRRNAKDGPEGEDVLTHVDGAPRRRCGTAARSARTAENSFEAWLKERGERWERDRHREDAELGEFELLETAADEFSFSSTSSFFDALLRRDGRRFSSTPVKSPPESAFRRRVAGPPGGANARPTAERLAGEDAEESDSSTRGDAVFPNPREPFGFRVSAPPYDERSYRDDGRAGSPEARADSTLVPRVEFDDDDTWNEPESLASSPAKTDVRPGRVANGKDAVPEVAEPDGPSDGRAGPPPTCRRVAEPFPALKPKPRPPPAEAAESESPGEPGPGKSALLRERLVELETEIERFRKENAALRRLRQENREVQENLRRERTEFQQNMADERAEWDKFKSEETRKFQREKKSFEKHAAAARARPDKRERDEIQTLKQQLDALQEDLRKREARWSGAHGRLGQRIDALNAENAALRDQVRTLEKLRLGTWKNEQEKERGRSGNGSNVRTRKSESPCKSVKNSPPENGVNTVGQNHLPNPAKSSSATRSTDWEKEPPSPAASSLRATSSEADGRRLRPRLLQSSARSVTEADVPDDTAATSDLEQEDVVRTEGKIEKECPDGGRTTVFPNGTRKRVSADGLTVTVAFFNGDVKRTMPDERVIYYYAEAQTTHTTYPDGLEVLQFPNNQIEKHYTDGRKEIVFPDRTVKNLYPDGREESVLLDGTVIRQNPDGTKEIRFSSGQRELHAAEFKRREYPDGTVKTVYSDGRQETRYPDGRVRLKNPEGRVVSDARPS